jgi:hypothetical protein
VLGDVLSCAFSELCFAKSEYFMSSPLCTVLTLLKRPFDAFAFVQLPERIHRDEITTVLIKSIPTQLPNRLDQFDYFSHLKAVLTSELDAAVRTRTSTLVDKIMAVVTHILHLL